MAIQRTQKPIFDRVPPQNMEAEQGVLGAMLISGEAVGAAIEILHEKAEDVFYAERHQHIYQAMVSLFRQNIPIDSVTLLEQLQRERRLEESGGVTYIAELTNAVPTSANIEYYARIVLEAAILRSIIVTCTELAGEAYGLPEDVTGLLDKAESRIFAMAESRQINPIHKVSDLLEESINRIEEIIKNRSGITGLGTGILQLDEMLSGLQPSDMVILAARPSVGKTAFALNIAAHASINENKSVLVFSLEMSKEQLVQRLLCLEGSINSRRLRTGFLAAAEFPKLTKAADKLSRAPLYIDDTPNISILDLRSKARRHKATIGVDLVILDYLQLMSGSARSRSESRQVEIAEISRSIKGIARELRVPVLALSQLSREAEKDDMGSPKLSHLRESGAIEQDADVVLMLSRPPAHEAEGNENLIRLDIAKQRNGPTGRVKLLFDKNIQKFKNITEGPDAVVQQPPPSDEEAGAAYDFGDSFSDDGADDGVPF